MTTHRGRRVINFSKSKGESKPKPRTTTQATIDKKTLLDDFKSGYITKEELRDELACLE